MKLLICGSRTFTDYDFMQSAIQQSGFQPDLIISGGAAGADKLAERYAAEHGLPVDIHPANWAKFGRRAGAIRNAEMVNLADAVIAFPVGDAHGTKITINLAEKKGLPLKIYEK